MYYPVLDFPKQIVSQLQTSSMVLRGDQEYKHKNEINLGLHFTLSITHAISDRLLTLL